MGASMPGGSKTSVKSPLEIPTIPTSIIQTQGDFNELFAQQTTDAIAQRQAQLQGIANQQLAQAQPSGLQAMQSQSPWDALGIIHSSVAKAPAAPKKAIQISPRQPRERKIILED